ncbi:hypothetical protein GCM10009551_022140 [Nocardiopsis tropica]
MDRGHGGQRELTTGPPGSRERPGGRHRANRGWARRAPSRIPLISDTKTWVGRQSCGATHGFVLSRVLPGDRMIADASEDGMLCIAARA